MRPVAPDSGKAIVVQPGQQVSQGTPLFVVAGLNRLQVLTQVEETDLYQLKVGMPVQITGDGFSGLILRGNVTSIGMQSNAAESQGAYYDVVVEMDRSLPESRQDIRLGMSAHLQVILHRNENGFAVPVEALSYGEDGKAYILWRPTSGEPMQKVAVTPGKAVAQGVEVSGIDAGEILVPRTHPDNLTSIEPMSINLESH